MENLSEERKEESKALQSLVRIGWGSDHPVFRNLFASLFLPHGTPEQFDSFEALQRASASAANAEKFVEIFYNIDVLQLAAQVRVPTLVLHAKRRSGRPRESCPHSGNNDPECAFSPA